MPPASAWGQLNDWIEFYNSTGAQGDTTLSAQLNVVKRVAPRLQRRRLQLQSHGATAAAMSRCG